MLFFMLTLGFLLALQFMEVIRLENMSHFRDDMIMPGDIFLLQVSFHYSFLVLALTFEMWNEITRDILLV